MSPFINLDKVHFNEVDTFSYGLFFSKATFGGLSRVTDYSRAVLKDLTACAYLCLAPVTLTLITLTFCLCLLFLALCFLSLV